MHDHKLIEDLAHSPPLIWPRLIGRAQVLSSLAARERCTGADLEGAALAMGVRPRQAAALLKLYRDRMAGTPARGSQTGRHYRLDHQTGNLIQQAILNAGPDARLSAVVRETRRLAEELSVTCPSEKAIRTRFGDRPLEIDVKQRLSASCRFVADAVELDLFVSGTGDGRSGFANLLALIDAEQSAIIDFALFVGAPAAATWHNSLQQMRAALAIDNDVSVGLPNDMLDEVEHRPHRTQDGRYGPISIQRRVRKGEALGSLLGRQLGRIRLNRGQRGASKPKSAPVRSDLALAVIQRLVLSG